MQVPLGVGILLPGAADSQLRQSDRSGSVWLWRAHLARDSRAPFKLIHYQNDISVDRFTIRS